MGGKMSRNKGAQGERSLCMHLKLLGYDARRVIRTRAVGGFEHDNVPDVEIWEGGAVKYTFESKRKKDACTTIYQMYERERGDQKVCRWNMGGKLVVIGADFEEVRKTGNLHFSNYEPKDRIEARSHGKLLRMAQLLKGAMFLVVRDNHKYPLFIRYF